jgi:hypothetical protein
LLSLKGRLAQFNISLLFVLGALSWLFAICLKNEDPVFHYGGTTVALFFIAVCLYVFFLRYGQEEQRPSSGQNTSIEVLGSGGAKMVIRNPPDRYFTDSHTIALLRAMLLGYDENLCPDAKVIGDVANQQYEPYSGDEQSEFVRRHKEEVQGQRQKAKNLLLKAVPPLGEHTESGEDETID